MYRVLGEVLLLLLLGALWIIVPIVGTILVAGIVLQLNKVFGGNAFPLAKKFLAALSARFPLLARLRARA